VFEFNAQFSSKRIDNLGDADWDLDKYRIFLDRQINETTAFHARIGKGDPGGHSNDGPTLAWNYYYITTQLGYEIELTAGRFYWDWEGQYGLRNDDDSWMADNNRQGFGFKKDLGIANFALLFQRLQDDKARSFEDDKAWGKAYGDVSKLAQSATSKDVALKGLRAYRDDPAHEEYYRVAFNVNADFNEKVSAGLLGYFDLADENSDNNISTYGAYLKFRFHPAIEFKGLYYHQDAKGYLANEANAGSASDYSPFDFEKKSFKNSYDKTTWKEWKTEDDFDTANAWRVVLDIDQELLKFTSLWLEYGQENNYFVSDNEPYANFDADPNRHTKRENVKHSNGEISTEEPSGDRKIIFVKAAQKWNDKWDSWVRYNWIDYGNDYLDEFSQIGGGIGYQLNPAVHFELGYDHAKYADGTKDNLVRFQTVVNF
jgi:hypothetical protein